MTVMYLRLEIVRALRDLRYLALAIGAPVGFYLLFATLFGGPAPAPGQLPGTVGIMVAMAAFGGMWAVLSATGPRIAQERGSGWLRATRATPLRIWQVLAAKAGASMALALPAIVLVCATAAAAKGVRLSAWQWIGLATVMWLGTAPFSAMGIAIGFAVSSDAAYALSYGLYMAMSAIGGLWVPPTVLPAGMRRVADVLPSYRLADLGWQIAAGHPVGMADVAVLAAWTVGLVLLAWLAFRRPAARRSRRRAHGRTVTAGA